VHWILLMRLLFPRGEFDKGLRPVTSVMRRPHTSASFLRTLHLPLQAAFRSPLWTTQTVSINASFPPFSFQFRSPSTFPGVDGPGCPLPRSGGVKTPPDSACVPHFPVELALAYFRGTIPPCSTPQVKPFTLLPSRQSVGKNALRVEFSIPSPLTSPQLYSSKIEGFRRFPLLSSV